MLPCAARNAGLSICFEVGGWAPIFVRGGAPRNDRPSPRPEAGDGIIVPVRLNPGEEPPRHSVLAGIALKYSGDALVLTIIFDEWAPTLGLGPGFSGQVFSADIDVVQVGADAMQGPHQRLR